MMPRWRWAVVVGGLAMAARPATGQTGRFDLEALRRVVSLSEPQISPNGRSIVVVVSRPNYQLDRHDTELVLIDVASGAARTLTRDRGFVAGPRWSPTGDRLAFVAPSDTGQHAPQVWVMPLDGGDARMATAAPGGVLQFAWRPNGREIAYATEDQPPPRTGEETHNDGFEVGDDDYLIKAAAEPVHLWLAALDGSPARQLTKGEWSLTKADGTSPISWSADGKLIAFAAQSSPHSGDFRTSVIQVVDVATGDVRTVTSGFGMGPSFAPQGDLLAFSRPRGPAPWFSSHAIYLVSGAGGKERMVTGSIDRTFYGADWSPDGSALVLAASDATTTSLWWVPLDGAARRIALGDLEPHDLFIGAGGSIAFVGVEPGRPGELYLLTSPAAEPRRLTDYNAPTARLSLGKTEALEWKVTGYQADGVVTLPPGYQPGAKYPLLLVIHGGPMGSSTRGFSALPQLLAAKGWVIFEPNYRGSDNLGNGYQSAIIGDAGDGPGKDVMAGIATLVARGLVDTTRIGVSGWSYGGYMTTWLIGHFPRWRAALAGAALTDYNDSYNLSDINVTFGGGWGGSVWQAPYDRVVRDQSPTSYFGRINTPTLILSNTGDVRVPIVQSYKLYHALKDRGIPVKFVAYPIPGHFARDPVRVRDVYRRWIGWFEEHFGS